MAKTPLKKQKKNLTNPRTSNTARTKQSTKTNTSEIRDLISFIAQCGMNEINIKTADLELYIKRAPDTPIVPSELPFRIADTTPPPTPTPPPLPSTIEAPQRDVPNTVEVKSPMIGTFYRTPTPEDPPFVSVGDTIKKGQVLCIIEAMKLFNEIESEVSGTIVKILSENASPVEYDHPLFLVEVHQE